MSAQMEIHNRYGITHKIGVRAIMLGLLLGTLLGRPVEARAADSVCRGMTYEHTPHGWNEPLTLKWQEDGALEVVSCGWDQETKVRRLLRWATVYLPGIRSTHQNGQRILLLDTRDGAIDLGDLSSQPCLGKTHPKGRVECTLIFGEKRERGSGAIIWTLSLALGEDAGIASEVVFSPRRQPQPIMNGDARL